MNALLWHNAGKKSLPVAVLEAAAAHVRRLGTEPTNVILPVGEDPLGRPWPVEVGGLKVETHLTVKGNHLKVYATDGTK